jgi:hypothetical protein
MNKPWLKVTEGLHAAYYPLHFKKVNGHLIYSPGIDRFILVDHFDTWVTLEVAEILSSKLPTQVILLGEETPILNNDICIEFTIKDKTNMSIHGANILVARQTPSVRKIRGAGVVYRAGWPIDYLRDDRKTALLKLQEYALFCLRICHATKITNALHNLVPHKSYLDTYMPGMIPDKFKVPADQTTAPDGMVNTIKQILYQSDTVDEAMSGIEQMFADHTGATPSIRETFYKFVGMDQPAKLKNLAYDNSFTVRAV